MEMGPMRRPATVKKTAFHRHFAIAARDGGARRARGSDPPLRDFFDTVWRADRSDHAKNADFMLFDAKSLFSSGSLCFIGQEHPIAG
jgi:hypothetical protein